jgi:hypothetical protein
VINWEECERSRSWKVRKITTVCHYLTERDRSAQSQKKLAKIILRAFNHCKQSPMAARSKAWVCGRSLAGIVGSNTAECMECCVLSDRGLCDRLITRPEESYRLCCVWTWSWSLDNEETLTQEGLLPLMGGNGQWKLKEEALDRSLWRTRFCRGCGPVVRKTTEWMNEWMYT